MYWLEEIVLRNEDAESNNADWSIPTVNIFTGEISDEEDSKDQES